MKPVIGGAAIYRYNPACVCDFCANGGHNPNPMMAAQGGSYGYPEPHNPPGSRAPWAQADHGERR